jgi:hypothetical protein
LSGAWSKDSARASILSALPAIRMKPGVSIPE